MDSNENGFKEAIQENNEEKLKELFLSGAWKVFYKQGQQTPLHMATLRNQQRMLDIILRHSNTNINAVDSKGRTSLYIACNGRINDIVIKLLTYKADANISAEGGITPLMRASFNGFVPVINLLIEAGANIDAIDNNNCTAVSYALRREGNNPDGLQVLLNYNAKLDIPHCPKYNPLLFAVMNKPTLVDLFIPFCKNMSAEIFSQALEGAISTNQINIFQTLMKSAGKISVYNTNYILNSTISGWNLTNCFNLLWPKINHKLYVNPGTFSMLFYKIFKQRSQVNFFKNSLKTIINTPDFNCNLSDERLVISTIFIPLCTPGYNWILCKDILLEFIEYLNKQGLKLKNYDLILFVQYFKGCQFITELLAVFFEYDPELLVTMHDVINLSYLDDLNLTSLLLYNCCNLHLIYFSRSIYALRNLEKFTVDMLMFFVQRFTPTNLDTELIRSFEKFHHISLKVPTLMELSRNAFRKAVKNNKLKEVIKDLHIVSQIADILRFKTPINPPVLLSIDTEIH